jgi:hypothetical protein
MNSLKVGAIALAAAGSLSSPLFAAGYSWSGGSPENDNWSTSSNWSGGAAPVSSTATYIYYSDLDTGNVSRLDTPVFTIGRLEYTNSTGTHTLDLDGNRLVVAAKNRLCIGDLKRCGEAVISSGILQIGSTSNACSMVVAASAGTAGTDSQGSLRISGTVDAMNLQDLTVGYTASSVPHDCTGRLDLAGAVLVSPGGPNTLTVNGTLRVGCYGAYASGTVLLPPSLQSLEVGGDFQVGALGRSPFGTLDFGSASQLTNLSVKGTFYLGCSGYGALLNWPGQVNVTLGTPSSPASMFVAHGGGQFLATGALTVSNAAFTAYLSDWKIGGHFSSSTSIAGSSGVVDLAYASAVQVGDTPNTVKCGMLWLGHSENNGAGTLLLPPSVTSIEVGQLVVGGGKDKGTLDLGLNSQLQSLTVTNGFFLAASTNGALFGSITAASDGAIRGFPAGVAIAFGTAAAPIPIAVGDCYQYGTGAKVGLTPSGGTFSAYASLLKVGLNRRDDVPGSGVTATLDLRATTLGAFEVSGPALIGCWTNTVTNYMNNRLGKGILRLPPGNAHFGAELRIGDADTTSYGLVELNGTRVRADGLVEVNATGHVTNHLTGASGGFDLTTTNTSNLALGAAGAMCLSFDADPVMHSEDYWGLRMAGHQVAFLSGLVASGRITNNTASLSARNQKRFGIYYNADKHHTFIGLPRQVAGATIIVR